MFYTRTENGYLLRVRLAPNSSSCRFLGQISGPNDEDYLKVGVVSVPEKGLANKELIAFLAKKTGFPKSAFNLVSGATNHWKKLFVQTDEDFEAVLQTINGEKP